MPPPHRIDKQPVFLLNSKPWRENSLRLDVFSRDHGRIALLARSARTRGSELRGVIVPFVPFSASWYGKDELKTLHRAEWLGGWAQPQSRLLFSGLYAHELVLRLTAPEDPNPAVFAALERLLCELCTRQAHTAALRRFEWALLDALGLCPDLRRDHHGDAIHPEALYRIRPEAPPERITQAQTQDIAVSGAVLLALPEGNLHHAHALQAASQMMKMLIAFRLPHLHTRNVLEQLQQFKHRLAHSAP
ncbi:DNA repair protein RecO [Conchiformibius steedae]|uniref:DNA repair protein RecO n=1 Tax=Conchiformibius steedae TaxID=153493 RepID=A0A3P2A8T3_9NEIS|nr:DNA repair protein RecO [Conchiformibius steedae]RRD91206.1 DNA repair protein RecO [Conchiformibius steedae]